MELNVAIVFGRRFGGRPHEDSLHLGKSKRSMSSLSRDFIRFYGWAFGRPRIALPNSRKILSLCQYTAATSPEWRNPRLVVLARRIPQVRMHSEYRKRLGKEVARTSRRKRSSDARVRVGESNLVGGPTGCHTQCLTPAANRAEGDAMTISVRCDQCVKLQAEAGTCWELQRSARNAA